ncbi:MAG: flagellar motor protein MotB [Alphaproteobacteria bacterium]|nr:flagellar motor protein MotB [Alphaproteobacteria bacterium]
MADKQDELRPIIVKKVKKGGHGHHGGAWKVAYADFVTAMMAFFLLLWLLSVTTEVQKDGIADYFTSNPAITRSESGASGLLAGTTVAKDGAMTSKVQELVHKPETQDPALRPGSTPPRKETNISDERFEAERRKREAENFKKAEAALKKAIKSTPELKEMSSALKVDMTPEGLRIQIVDQEGKPLFASGSAVPLTHTKNLLRKVAGIIQKLPNEISVRGHTDSVPYGSGATYTNWELSADRANSSRRELLNGGLPAARFNNVVGKADTDHLFPDSPMDGKNRRISIILLHEGLTLDEGANKSDRAVRRQADIKKELYQKTEGKVEFP